MTKKSRKQFLLTFPAILILFATLLPPAPAGSELERQVITEAYRTGEIDRETYVARKLASYFSKGDPTYQGITSGSRPGSGEITLLLKEAALNLDQYDADTRDFIRVLLRRPDDTSYAGIGYSWYLTDPEVYEPETADYPNIGGKVKIWYTTSDSKDGGGPHTAEYDFVLKVANALEDIYQTEITDLGYPVPPDDGGQTNNGGDEKFDLYLINCGKYGIYGYTTAEGPAEDADANAWYSFIVIDNDFTEFEAYGTPAEDSMKATLSHEYHHVIQMGINVNVSGWYMEATSAWMEDQVFDDIDDNRQYLPDFFEYPETPLDDELSDYHLYGAWIWNEYLETSWDQAIIRAIWERFDPVGSDNAVDAISDELVSRGENLKSAFSEFVTVNYAKSGFYKDAGNASYVDVPAQATHELGSNADEVTGTVTVDHLAANYIKFTPGASGDGTLTLSVDGEDGTSVNAAAIQKTADGAFVEYPFSLDDTPREASVSVPDFSTTGTDEVMLTLLNYSESVDDLSITYSASLEREDASDSSGGGCFIGSVLGY